MDFRYVIQPILDRHCTNCHDGGQGEKKSFDLRGEKWVSNKGAFFYPECHVWRVSDSFRALLPYVSYKWVGDYQGPVLPVAAYESGSAKSKLMALLKKGHYGVALGDGEWRALASWIRLHFAVLWRFRRS